MPGEIYIPLGFGAVAISQSIIRNTGSKALVFMPSLVTGAVGQTLTPEDCNNDERVLISFVDNDAIDNLIKTLEELRQHDGSIPEGE